MAFRIKRVHEPPARGDGKRVLIDRLWPRGVSKERAAVDLWLKEIAPTTELRKWFDHDPERWEGFKKRYRAELERNPEPVERLLEMGKKRGGVTLLFATKAPVHHGLFLVDYLAELGP